jgi:hypothetical protein
MMISSRLRTISERIATGAFGNIVAQTCAAENSAIRVCGSVSSRGSAGMGLIRSYACTPLKSGFLVLNSDKSENGETRCEKVGKFFTEIFGVGAA